MIEFQQVNANKLEDVSYTMSYSVIGESWDSFHTYISDKLFNSRNNLYSFKNNKIYKHNANNKCIYYNGVDKCYISPVFTNKDKTFILNNIYIETDVVNADKIRIDKTFNKLTVVNNYQGSNTISLVPYDVNKSALDNYDVANTRRVRNGWFFNKFRNKKANEFVKIVTESLGKYVHNTIYITDLNEGINRIIDNHVVILLEYDNTEQYDLFIYNIDINANPVER